MTVRLHIEHLVIEGLALEAAHEPVVRAALQEELARRLAEHAPGAAWRDGGGADAVRGPTLRLPAAATPAVIGRQVGAAIYGSLEP